MVTVDTRKVNLIQWISSIHDENILSEIEEIQSHSGDWWDKISDGEKSEIEEGLAQADRGELIPHEQVMGKYEKWLTK